MFFSNRVHHPLKKPLRLIYKINDTSIQKVRWNVEILWKRQRKEGLEESLRTDIKIFVNISFSKYKMAQIFPVSNWLMKVCIECS